MAGKKLSDTSERVVRATITIKPSMLKWLKKQGGISQIISGLIEDKMKC